MMRPGEKNCSIGEVSRITGVAPHVLRYWESEFPVLRPKKNLSGRREYGKIDIDAVFRIKQLLYDELYTVAGARRKLEEKTQAGGEAAGFLIREMAAELRDIISSLE